MLMVIFASVGNMLVDGQENTKQEPISYHTETKSGPVYINFDHEGPCPKPYLWRKGFRRGPRLERVGRDADAGDQKQDVCYWLRLGNGSKWAISFDTDVRLPTPDQPLFVKADGKSARALAEDWEVSVHYWLESEPCPSMVIVMEDSEPDPCQEIEPPGVPWIDVNGISWLLPRSSVIFPVPKHHLADRLKLFVPYRYDWERGLGTWDSPQHRVYFRHYDLLEAEEYL